MKTLAPLFFLILLFSCNGYTPATLILTNGEVYTMEEDQAWAGTIVITGNTISAVSFPCHFHTGRVGQNLESYYLFGI